MDTRLDFKDFSTSSSDGLAASSNKQQPMSGKLLDSIGTSSSSFPSGSSSGEGGDGVTKSNFLSISHYRRFFDVDDEQVFTRILNSFIPRRKGNFISDFVQPLPDLWGPFWISVTLVFSIAIVGNFAHFLHTYGSLPEGQEFQSDFSFVTGATSLVFAYLFLLPSAIYTYVWYHRASGLQYSFFDLLSAYGYSLSLFVPVSIICPLVPFNIVRWALVILAALLSGAVLVLGLWAMVKDDPHQLNAVCLVVSAFVAHVILAVCLKEFFFDATGFQTMDFPTILPHHDQIVTGKTSAPNVVSPATTTTSHSAHTNSTGN